MAWLWNVGRIQSNQWNLRQYTVTGKPLILPDVVGYHPRMSWKRGKKYKHGTFLHDGYSGTHRIGTCMTCAALLHIVIIIILILILILFLILIIRNPKS